MARSALAGVCAERRRARPETASSAPAAVLPLRDAALSVLRQGCPGDFPSLRVEDAGREPQKRVHVALGHQPTAHRLARAALAEELSGTTTAARPLLVGHLRKSRYVSCSR